MHRVGRWLERGRLQASTSSQSLDSLAESQNLESALKAVELIMDDDMEGAERGLSQGNSAFHQLCRGVIGFMRATLGFEQDIMKEASGQLAAAESSAYNAHYRAQRDSGFHSSIYEKGSEFALCQAMAQIMGAVVGVLNESLTESIRGFYKLRKAYMALDGLMQMENAAVRAGSVKSLASSRGQSPDSIGSSKEKSADQLVTAAAIPGRSQEEAHANQPSGLRQTENVDDDGNGSDGSDEFYEVDDIQANNPVTTNYTGKIDTNPTAPTAEEHAEPSETATEKLSSLSITGTARPSSSGSTLPSTNNYNLLTADPSDPMFDSSLDTFIHSGTNLCFGLISLLISMIPPAFSKLLYIIGFRGDRDRGMRMLWQASKFPNINGAMAGLIILGWYNGLVGFCDIIIEGDAKEQDEIEGYPTQRLRALLTEMRRRYPKSHLWLIEEARMASSARDLDRALDLLSAPTGKSQLKQIQALHVFEKSLYSMNAHRYQLCADSFIACVDLNSWSQALYFYIAASSHLMVYRNTGDKKHKALAEEYFKVAPTKTGKKKVMGRQLPFDVFVNRKIAKWTARSEAWGCGFIEAVGVSPFEEMVLLWNGFKKMDKEQLELSLDNLAWSDSGKNEFWSREEGVDEKAILAVLRANVLRNLGRYGDSKRILREEVLCHDSYKFKGHNKDDWTAPTAHYEMGVNLWMERSQYVRLHGKGVGSGLGGEKTEVDLEADRKLVSEAKGWVEKAKGWEKYELDARIGMKITAAVDAIKKWEGRYGVGVGMGKA